MSFFATDKDLRKVPSKRANQNPPRGRPLPSTVHSPTTGASQTISTPTPIANLLNNTTSIQPNITGGGDCKDDIVAIAKQERESRQTFKKHNECATAIQAWYRGRKSSQRYYSNIQEILISQLNDINKVKAMLAAKQQQQSPSPSSTSQPVTTTFVVPVHVATTQLIQIILLLKNRRKKQSANISKNYHTAMTVTAFQQLFNMFCSLVVIPSAEATDSTKNLIVSELKAKNGFRRLRVLFSTLLHGLVEQKNEAATLVIYSNTINALLFDKQQKHQSEDNHNQNNMSLKEDTGLAKSQLRSEIFGYRLLPEMRKLIIDLSHNVALLAVDEMDTFQSVKEKVSKTLLGVVNANTMLFSIARRMILLSNNEGQSDHEMKFQLFVKDILTIPFITVMLHDSQILDIVMDEEILVRIFELLMPNTSVVAAKKSPFSGGMASSKTNTTSLLEELEQSVDDREVTKLQYLVANISSLFCSSAIAKLQQEMKPVSQLQSPSTSSQNTDLIAMLIKFLVQFIEKIYISDVSNDALKISWKVSGTRMIAMEKPKLYVLQYTVILDRAFLTMLLNRVAITDTAEYNHLDWHQWAIGTDENDIASSLSSSSSGLVNKRLHDAQSSWFASSWAAKLGLSSVSNSVAYSTLQKSKENKGILSWFSSFGSKKTTANEKQIAQDFVLDSKRFHEVSRLFALVLSPASITKYTSKSWKAVSSIAYSCPLVAMLWYKMHKDYKGFEDICTKFNPEDTKKYSILSDSFCVLATFLSCLKVHLISMDDLELYDQQKPLPLHQVLPLIRGSNTLLFKMLKYNAQITNNSFTVDSLISITSITSVGTTSSKESRQTAMILDCYSATIKNLHFILADLYTRWARRPFSTVETWLVSGGNAISLNADGGNRGSFSFAILQWMPWSVDFSKRLKFVRDELDRERIAIQGGHDPYGLGGGFRSQGTIIRIRRTQVLVDGMRSLMSLSAEQWRDRIVVRYVNELGADEAGIDVGGLFKDFVTDLSSTIFDPSYGLFSQTFDGLLYPNPSAGSIYQSTELEDMFLFIGRVLGKAILENITISPQFTHFFLAFMHGRYNFMNLIDDLATLDPDLFKNLMFLKNCEGDMVGDLGLTFSMVDGLFGRNQEIELIPGGGSISVNARNRHWYVSCVAKYYLHDRIRVQAGAFFRGLHELVNPMLLRIFCPPEVQIMISGSVSDINLEDWKSYTRYAGGYTSLDPYIVQFWAILDSFSEAERGLLLRFITSVPRPPSLGFSALNPPFTIQRVDVENDARLPTASTCFNILKLPRYSSKAVLKEKLLLAINSRAGFDLS